MSYGRDFASVYDRFTDNVEYRRRADYLLDLLKAGGITEGILLDVACGTGMLTQYLCKKGYDLIAADCSPDMLQIARERLRKADPAALVLCQDMRSLDLYGTVDAAVCTLDSVNHRTETADVRRSFSCIGLFLRPGGLFVFDVNTPYKHEKILSGNTFVYEDDDAYLVWQNDECDETGTVEIMLDIFLSDGAGTYTRACEDFAERAYPMDMLDDLLRETGFSVEHVFGDMTDKAPADQEERVYFVARKM